MATSHLSAADQPRQPTSAHLTLGWFARRGALWLLTVAAGVGMACFLYAFADESNGQELQASPPGLSAQQHAKAH